MHKKDLIIGVDVGGTKIQVGLVTPAGIVLQTLRVPANKKTTKQSLAAILTAIASVFGPRVKAIGIGITGQVDISTGVVKYSPNLPKDWENVPLKKIVSRRFGVPVTVDNDAHCIALAEALVGAGKGHFAVLGMTLGTGVGTALVINKKIFRGGSNIIEFGHTIINNNGARCSCGLTDHFEAYVSGPAMIRRYRELSGTTKNPLEIETAAKKGDRKAKKVFAEMSVNLAKGLADAIHSYNPSIVVLGGGLGKVKLLTRPAIKLVKRFVRYPGLKKTIITTSKLKYEAGVVGAALITKK